MIRVTITGADDAVPIDELVELACRYPRVEWGILYSEKAPRPRYPSKAWVSDLWDNFPSQSLSLHLCGAASRETLEGNVTLLKQAILWGFGRVQLNGYMPGSNLLSNPDTFLGWCESPGLDEIILQVRNPLVLEQVAQEARNLNQRRDQPHEHRVCPS